MKAFPTATLIHDEVIHTGGMDLRDYFAAKVLHGYLCVRDTHLAMAEGRIKSSELAQNAYLWADAMMKAREVR